MKLSLKFIIIILAILDFLIILPSLFIINGHIWLDIYFIFWYIIFLELWLLLIYFLKKKARKLPEKNREDFLIPLVLFFSCILGLSFSQGVARTSLFWFPWLWFVIKIVITIFLILYFISKYQLLKVYKKKTVTYIKNNNWINRFYKKLASIKIKKRVFIPLLAFLLIFQTLFYFPLVTNPIMTTMAKKNVNELHKLISDLTDKFQDDENKTKSILKWFDRYTGNIYNTWAPPAITTLSSKNVYFSIAIGDPYYPILCVRTEGDNDPLWLLTSRCGNCGEHSLLFTEMAIAANLTVRRIHVNGIDHKWNEVKIKDEWIITDPSWVVNKDGEDGYNVNSSNYEGSQGQFIYVYAKYPNQEDNVEDVTYRYTDLALINISTIDLNNNSIPNINLKVYAIYGNNKIDTGLQFSTNEFGTYELKIGGGEIFFDCVEKDKHIYNNLKREVIENQYNDIVLIVD